MLSSGGAWARGTIGAVASSSCAQLKVAPCCSSLYVNLFDFRTATPVKEVWQQRHCDQAGAAVTASISDGQGRRRSARKKRGGEEDGAQLLQAELAQQLADQARELVQLRQAGASMLQQLATQQRIHAAQMASQQHVIAAQANRIVVVQQTVWGLPGQLQGW